MTEALIINCVVLAVVLESDLGRHRTVSWFRVARPLITAVLIVPFFIKGLALGGPGLLMEVGCVVLGLLLGLVASSRMQVYRSPKTGKAVTRAGLQYAVVWVVVSAARVLFSFGSQHWWAGSLGSWLVRHDVALSALTDSLIVMALAMVITRVVVMAARARRLEPAVPLEAVAS